MPVNMESEWYTAAGLFRYLKDELIWVHYMIRLHILVFRHPKPAFNFQLHHVIALCLNYVKAAQGSSELHSADMAISAVIWMFLIYACPR